MQLDIGTKSGLRVSVGFYFPGSDHPEETNPGTPVKKKKKDPTLVHSFDLLKFINITDIFNRLYCNLSINTETKRNFNLDDKNGSMFLHCFTGELQPWTKCTARRPLMGRLYVACGKLG